MSGTSFFPINSEKNILTQWFIDIGKILNKKNYDNGNFNPNIINLTGVTPIGTWIKKGSLSYFTVIIDGTSSTSSAYINNLVETAINYGISTIYNITDNTLIGNGYINYNTTNCIIPDWNVTSKKILISGFFETKGE